MLIYQHKPSGLENRGITIGSMKGIWQPHREGNRVRIGPGMVCRSAVECYWWIAADSLQWEPVL